MPRPRKYDYKYDLPATFFITVPLYLKEELEKVVPKKELNDVINKFLSEFVENYKKNG